MKSRILVKFCIMQTVLYFFLQYSDFDIVILTLIFLLRENWIITGGCRSRDYGHGSIVCVCDTSHCDTLPHINPPNLPSVFIISTNKAGRRWEVTSGNFIDLPNDDSSFSDVSSGGCGFPIHISCIMVTVL